MCARVGVCFVDQERRREKGEKRWREEGVVERRVLMLGAVGAAGRQGTETERGG